jgi:hypothetical protein
MYNFDFVRGPGAVWLESHRRTVNLPLLMVVGEKEKQSLWINKLMHSSKLWSQSKFTL